MLKSLIASKTRRLLLSTFFSNLETEYYTRQLASMLGISAGTIHREIGQMETSGILKARRVGNIKLFSLNRQNPVYEEIKNIVYKTEGAIKLVKDAVSGVKGIKVAFIYGSFAKGNEKQDSDIDIFLLGDNIDENDLLIKISHLDKQLSKEINYTRYTESDYEGEKMKRNSFLLGVLKGKKIFIKGGESDL